MELLMETKKAILATKLKDIPTSTSEETEVPDYTVTLNELLSSAAADWSSSHRLALIAALRDQRERWNQEQSLGSRKRVTSKQIKTKKKGKVDLALEGLKL